MIYFCSQKNRRALVLHSQNLNGIDYLEVLGPPGCGTQLAITFLKDPRPLLLTKDNIAISGGLPVTVQCFTQPTDDDPLVAIVTLKQTGDFSTYTLALVAASGSPDPPAGIDPQLSTVTFSFKAGCPSPADCAPDNCCPPPSAPEPDINYLAKDYDGFRQVMLDRMAVIASAWTETHAADLGIAMVETLAYAADHLSYQQDAVSTEAYIGTARSRISMRRHARLVDYRIGEGSNARALIYVQAAANITLPAGTLFYVRVSGLPAAALSGDPVAQQLQKTTQPIFAAIEDAALFVEQSGPNAKGIPFYTWSDADCCLPPGATEATLVGNLTTLLPGQALIFEEICGPLTGDPADADPTHRWAVCLTGVRQTTDPLTGDAVTEITWADQDALPFPLCISSTTDAENGSLPVYPVSVAWGNIVLADHGVWIQNEALGEVPPAPPSPDSSASCTCGTQSPVASPLPRYYPELANSPLTFSVPFSGPLTSAEAFLSPDSSTAVAQISLAAGDGSAWKEEPDLLSSDGTDRVFVAEIESDGSVFLRFGDGQYGAAPDTGLSFSATYRTGNGSAGNVGRDSFAHAVLPATVAFPLSDIAAVRNPLAAAGGVDPEDNEHIRQYAPFAFETQLRCVTEDDYGQAAQQIAGVQEARGTLRWTGSWYTAFVSIDPTASLTTSLTDTVTSRLNLLRMMGTDLAVEGAVIVGLRIEMEVCVDPDHFQGDVYTALMNVFITGNQCSGQSGLLNAANFTFGETVYASPLIAAAQAVEGVLSVTLVTFTRMDNPSVDGVAQGFLTMGRLEIPHCDNDPNHLDHGVFALQMDGGK